MENKKKSYIMDKADLKRKPAIQEEVEKFEPRRRAVMTSDDDELFIKKYYKGRTEAFRTFLREDKIKKGWL